MTDVPALQKSLQSSDVSFKSDTVATDLYQCSRQLFLDILKGPADGSHHDLLQSLRHQAQRFNLWGSSFEAQNGGLDERLVGADRLKETLLHFLCSMGETLGVLAQRLGRGEELAELCSRAQHIKAQTSDMTREPGPGGNELLSTELLDALDSSDSEDSSVNEVVELQELLQDIRSYNSCLFGLSSVLEEPAESISIDSGKSKEDITGPQDMIASTAGPYMSSVTEPDQGETPNYARRLGEANELRYEKTQSEQAIDDVISASAAGASHPSQFDERMAVTSQNFEGKKGDDKKKPSRSFDQGDEGGNQIVGPTKETGRLGKQGRMVEEGVEGVQERYFIPTEMLGEESEQVKRLNAEKGDSLGKTS